MAVSFYSRETEFVLGVEEQGKIQRWILRVLDKENPVEVGELTVVFCSDEFLLGINQQFLEHDYYTDIITFPYSSNPLSSDLMISVDRVRENAKNLNIGFDHELRRVIIHGILHLCGYEDDTDEAVEEIRSRENFYLAEWNEILEER